MRLMIPTSRLIRIGIAIQRLRSASIELTPRIQGGGGLLGGMIEFDQRLQQ